MWPRVDMNYLFHSSVLQSLSYWGILTTVKSYIILHLGLLLYILGIVENKRCCLAWSPCIGCFLFLKMFFSFLNRHSLREVLDAPNVMSMIKDTKAAQEVTNL